MPLAAISAETDVPYSAAISESESPASTMTISSAPAGDEIVSDVANRATRATRAPVSVVQPLVTAAGPLVTMSSCVPSNSNDRSTADEL